MNTKKTLIITIITVVGLTIILFSTSRKVDPCNCKDLLGVGPSIHPIQIKKGEGQKIRDQFNWSKEKYQDWYDCAEKFGPNGYDYASKKCYEKEQNN